MDNPPNNERPLALALILCDQIITEAGTFKKSLIGAFNSVMAERLPVIYPHMAVYASLTNGQGNTDAKLRCVSMEAADGLERTLWEVNAPIAFANPNQVVELCFDLNRITFDTPGLHSLELYCADELLMERRFHVNIASPQK